MLHIHYANLIPLKGAILIFNTLFICFNHQIPLAIIVIFDDNIVNGKAKIKSYVSRWQRKNLSASNKFDA